MITTAEQLQEMIENLREQHGDLTECEVKRGLGGVPTLGPSLCAFGNMPNGGTVIIGLDESRDFAVNGVPDLAAMRHGVATQARQAVIPPVSIDFHDFLVDDARVLVGNIAGLPLQYRPARYQDRAYLRQADGDYMMSDAELDMLEDRKRRAAADGAMWAPDDGREIPDSGLDDLDEELAETVIRNSRNRNARHRDVSDDVLLRDLGVCTRSGSLTVAGAYVLGRFPQRFVPSWSATAAVQLPAGSDERTRDLLHTEGPVPAMYAELMAWVKRNIHTTISYRADGNAFDESELPAVAVRELLTNALVHRDLGPHSRGKEVDIRLTGDKLTIRNPGGLRGITTEQLGRPGGRHAVNGAVYRLCERLTLPDGTRLIEAAGGGIREARHRTEEAGLKPLTFHDTGVAFIAIVSRRRLLSADDLMWLTANTSGHRLDRTQRVILSSMSHGQEWTNKMVREEFDRIDSRAAQALLQDLVARDLAETIGEYGGTHYRLAPHLPFASDDVVTVVESSTSAPETTDDAPTGADPTPNERTLLELLAAAPGSTVAEIADATGLTTRQVRYSLRNLAAAEAVTESPGRPAKWSLPD